MLNCWDFWDKGNLGYFIKGKKVFKYKTLHWEKYSNYQLIRCKNQWPRFTITYNNISCTSLQGKDGN